MARLSFYADATALIGLARIDRLDLLTLLPTPVYVTEVVWQEAARDPAKPGVVALQRARDVGLLEIVDEGDPEAFPQLGRGEATVLSAAVAARAAVLVDERKARALVNTDPGFREAILQTTGILGLILLAKRRGRIEAVRPLLDELLRQNFWVGPDFYRELLRQAGES